MSRLRLRVSPQDRAFVLAQGSTRRSYRPFAQAFGTKRVSEAHAELIVTATNCHQHLVKALQRIQREAQRPVNGNGARMRTRLSLIARHAATALSRVSGS
jgi:hypothetical protein